MKNDEKQLPEPGATEEPQLTDSAVSEDEEQALMQTPETPTTETPQSTDPTIRETAEQTPADAQPNTKRPEMLASDDEVDQQVAACWKNYRTLKHEFGRWLREKKSRLVGRGRDGEWEPYLKAPERNIPLSTANDIIRRFEEREGLRPVSVKIPDSGNFTKAAGNATPPQLADTVGGTPTSEPPQEIFVPVGQVTEEALQNLATRQEEAAKLPDPLTRVQLPECTPEDRKRFENAVATLREAYGKNTDAFQLALAATEFYALLIHGGLSALLQRLRNLSPCFEELNDCQLVLECLSRIASQIGEFYEAQDHHIAA